MPSDRVNARMSGDMLQADSPRPHGPAAGSIFDNRTGADMAGIPSRRPSRPPPSLAALPFAPPPDRATIPVGRYLLGEAVSQFTTRFGLPAEAEALTPPVCRIASEPAPDRVPDPTPVSSTTLQESSPASFVKPPRLKHLWSPLSSLVPRRRSAKAPAVDQGGMTAACCTVMSFEALANVSDATSTSVGMKPATAALPHGAAIGTTALTAYIGAAAAKSSVTSFRSFRQQERRLKTSLGLLAEADRIRGAPTAESRAARHLLNEELQTARFCKWIPGASSGGSATLITAGQFIGKVTPIGLYLTTVNCLAHVGDAARQIHNTRRRLRRVEGDDEIARVQRRHYRQQISLLYKDAASWALTAAGSASLGTISLAAWTAAAVHAGPILAAVGFAAIAPGIVGTIAFNTPLYGKRFTPGLSKVLADQVAGELASLKRGGAGGQLPTEAEARGRIQRSERQREIAKSFRRHVLDNETAGERAKRLATRIGHKALVFATIGLFQNTLLGLKRKTKQRATKRFHADEQRRLTALAELRVAEGLTADLPERSDALDRLFQALEAGGETAGHIGKLLARRVIQQKTSIQPPDRKASMRSFFPRKQRTNRIRLAVQDLLQGECDNGLEISENLELLTELGPCCSGAFEANAVLATLQERFASCAGASTDSRVRLEKLLTGTVDQYLFYQLRNDARQDRALWSRTLSAFQATRVAANGEDLPLDKAL